MWYKVLEKCNTNINIIITQLLISWKLSEHCCVIEAGKQASVDLQLNKAVKIQIELNSK